MNTTRTDIAVGDTVKFDGDNRWWTVRAADTRFVILTRQAPFQPKGESVYTIIDWERGLRGPCDRIGQGWDVDKAGGCESLLSALNGHVQVSYRNNLPIEIVEVRSKGAA